MIAGLALALVSSPALAEGPDGNDARKRAMPSPQEMFEKADADGDGSVSQEEWAAFSEMAREHARERHENRPSPEEMSDRIFDRIDADGDDSVTREEFREAGKDFAEKHRRHGERPERTDAPARN